MSILLLCSVLFPLVCGMVLLALKSFSEKNSRLLSIISVLITSCLVGVLFFCDETLHLTVIHFTDALSFSFCFDGLGKFFAGMIAFLWPFATLYSFVYMKHENQRQRYYGFYLMTYGVVLGIAMSANALTLYVFYEMLTFITLPLITHTQTKEARKAGRLYLYYSLSGSSLALAGIVIFAVTSGSCDFVPGGTVSADNDLALFAYFLTFVGFGVKAAIFPLCRWLPMASAAPTPTTALLHAVAVVKSGAFAIIRMTYFVLGAEILQGSWAQLAAVFLAAMTVVYGSCMSLKEQHFKRRFAFSTVSNLSYILLGALLATQAGLEASLLHFLMHSITKIGIFFCVGALIETTGAVYVYELNGLGKKAPLTFMCYTISGLSLSGIPPFCGFISKYYLLSSSISQNGLVGYVAVGAIIISAILTAVYVLSISFRAFVREPNDFSKPICEKSKEPEKGFVVITSAFAIFSLVLGIAGEPVLTWISDVLGGIAL